MNKKQLDKISKIRKEIKNKKNIDLENTIKYLKYAWGILKEEQEYFELNDAVWIINDLLVNIEPAFQKTVNNIKKNYHELLDKLATEKNQKISSNLDTIHGPVVAMRHALHARNFDVNSKNIYEGNTPLYEAVVHSNLDVVELLLEYGADPNLSNNKSVTPLHQAAWLDLIDIARLLINVGANVNVKDANGYTPLDMTDKGMPMHNFLLKHGATLALEDGK